MTKKNAFTPGSVEKELLQSLAALLSAAGFRQREGGEHLGRECDGVRQCITSSAIKSRHGGISVEFYLHVFIDDLASLRAATEDPGDGHDPRRPALSLNMINLKTIPTFIIHSPDEVAVMAGTVAAIFGESGLPWFEKLKSQEAVRAYYEKEISKGRALSEDDAANLLMLYSLTGMKDKVATMGPRLFTPMEKLRFGDLRREFHERTTRLISELQR